MANFFCLIFINALLFYSHFSNLARMKVLPIVFLVVSLSAMAQPAEQDSSGFDATMQWLERKLTYNYYDPTNEKWWVNVIQVKDNGAYVIKNIAAKHPDHVSEKIYYQRTFFLWDLNPKTVTVSDIPKNMGRFIKGKLIRLEGFGNEKEIATKKDGRVGSKVSYLNISIPAILEDSTQGYAQAVGDRLSDVLYLNARLFNLNNTEENISAAFKAFRGNYISEDSTSYLDFEVMDVGLVRFKLRERSRELYGTIGYDVKKDVIFYLLASTKDHITRQFKFDTTKKDLILREGGDEIYVIGRNTIEFFIEGKKTKFFRY